MDKAVSIVIVDDHELIRKGLKQVLEERSNLTLFEASNGKEALEVIREQKPEIAILDIEMPVLTGLEVAKSVQNEGLSIEIIFLTMYNDESMFNKAMDIGVKGYVLKENTVSEIVQSLKAVMDGKYYVSPAISDFLLRRNSKFISPASDASGLYLLTPSERNMLRLVGEMKTNQEIAVLLNISIKTVQNHRNNMCNKLGLKGTHALLKFAVDQSSQL